MVVAQPMSANNGLFGNGNGNGNGIGPSGHMDGNDILEVIKDSPSLKYVMD